MTGVSTRFKKVSGNPFCKKMRSHLIETYTINVKANWELPVNVFSRRNTGNIFKHTVESGF